MFSLNVHVLPVCFVPRSASWRVFCSSLFRGVETPLNNNNLFWFSLVSCFHVFLSHIIIITFEQCAELTVAITITHRNVTDTACRKCKFRCSLQLNGMKQIMKWLLETLIFIKISPQSVYGKYFIIKKFFFAHIAYVDPVNGNIEISGFHWLIAWNFNF